MSVLRRDFSSYFNDVKKAVPVKQKKDYSIPNSFELTYEDGKANVLIRFLPSNVNESVPFIENRKHFQKNSAGKFFVFDCASRFGLKCPLCAHNQIVYKDAKTDAEKKEAAKYATAFATKKYTSNIYVIRNDNAPETEGKIYRWTYGPQIMKKINTCMTGTSDLELGDVEPRNPFDWFEGANFTIKATQGQYGPNFDESKFSPLTTRLQKYDRSLIGKKDENGKPVIPYVDLTDEEIEVVNDNLLDLKPYETTQDAIDDYDTVCEKFEKFIGWKLRSDERKNKPADDVVRADFEAAPASTEDFIAATTPAPSFKKEESVVPEEALTASDDADDFIKSLANM